MKKIALHGSYFGDNFGDTLFVIHFLNWLNENKKEEVPLIYLPFASTRVRNLVEVSEKRGIRSIMKANGLVFIGGGYLGEPPTNSRIWSYRLIIRHLSIAILAFILRKPYIFIGVGAGPLSNKLARKLTVFLCNRSKKAIVRDVESKEYLVKYGVMESKIKVTADSILTLDSKDVNDDEKELIKKTLNFNKENNILIGVHLPVNKDNIDKLELIVKDLKKYCDRLKNFKIILFNDFYKENYDYIAYDFLREEFEEDKVTLVDYKDPAQLIALINELNIVITTKLHCGIVANCLGKYTLSISVHNKTIRLYRQLGLEEGNIAITKYKKGKLLEMLSNYNSEISYYNNIPNSIRELADENRKELYRFVRGL